MLVLTVKRNHYISVNNDKMLIQVLGLSKDNLKLKLFIREDDNKYVFDRFYYVKPDKPFYLNKTLGIHYLKGQKKLFKVGFEGNSIIHRCDNNIKFEVKRPRNLDDDFFNFDTEGY